MNGSNRPLCPGVAMREMTCGLSPSSVLVTNVTLGLDQKAPASSSPRRCHQRVIFVKECVQLIKAAGLAGKPITTNTSGVDREAQPQIPLIDANHPRHLAFQPVFYTFGDHCKMSVSMRFQAYSHSVCFCQNLGYVCREPRVYFLLLMSALF